MNNYQNSLFTEQNKHLLSESGEVNYNDDEIWMRLRTYRTATGGNFIDYRLNRSTQ